MFTYVIESKKDLKEIFCGLPLRNLVEIQQNFKNVIEIKNDGAEVLNDEYFIGKSLNKED